MFNEAVENDGEKKSERGDSGGHTKNDAKREHREGKEFKMVFWRVIDKKIIIWNCNKKGNEDKGDVIVNHGEFDIKGATERSNNQEKETGTIN